MKKIAFLLLLAALLLPACANAMTEYEWNLRCAHKLNSNATLYVCHVAEGEATRTDLHISAQNYVFTPVGNLPAGSYVQIDDLGFDGKMGIKYFRSGSTHFAYVDKSLVSNAFVTVRINQHENFAVPELCYSDPGSWYAVLSEKFGIDKAILVVEAIQNGGYTEPEKKPSTSTSNKTSNISTKKKTTENLTLDIGIETDDGLTNVTVKKLGVYESTIKLGEEERVVPTGQLVYEHEAAPEEALAVINAKNTGEVILRPQQETTGRVTKCKTGRVALVIEKGQSWSKLWYDGYVGYVQNKYLLHIPMAETAADAAVGDAAAPMHLGTHRDTRVVTRVKKGTAVKILWQGETWAEVAVDGWRGYIQLKYLKEE